MNNQAFDEALQHIVADAKLPYAPDAWMRVAQRLDAHETGRKKRRAIRFPLPVLRWAAAAAVVALALAAGWWLRDATDRTATTLAGAVALTSQKGSEMVQSPGSAPASGPLSASAAAQAPAATTADVPFVTRPPAAHRRAQAGGRKTSLSSFTLPLNGDMARASLPGAAPAQTVPSPSPDPQPLLPQEAPPTQAPRRAQQPVFVAENSFDGMGSKPARNTSFDVAGGYGFSNSLSAFAVGVAVKREVGSRLRVEGGLAFVGGAQSTRATVTERVAATPTGGGLGPAGVASTVDSLYSTPATARGFYVQASPSVSYRIHKGFSAGGGLDAQRLLNNPASATKAVNADAFNTQSNVTVSTPSPAEWDFGFTLRADYQLTQAVRVGLQHRESLRATADGERTTGRNYWLLQAGLRLR